MWFGIAGCIACGRLDPLREGHTGLHCSTPQAEEAREGVLTVVRCRLTTLWNTPTVAPGSRPATVRPSGTQEVPRFSCVARSHSRPTSPSNGKGIVMNHHRLARFLRLAVMSCVLLSCLLALHTPVLAIAIYDALAQVSVSTPGPLPPGTGITFSSSLASTTSQFQVGTAAASASTSASPPGTVSAIVTGVASQGGPDNSIARSSASALGFVTLFNQNTTTVLFPLTISHLLSTFTAEIPSSETGGATAQASFSVHFGPFLSLSSGSSGLCAGNDFESLLRPQCSVDDSGSTTLLFGLSPGSRFLDIEVFASGQAGSPEVVPEPTTLLLFGTTMAGLGLAHWRRRTPG